MRILVIPRTGVRLLDPKTMEQVPADGAVKEDGQYWRRRERDGDAVIRPAPAEAVEPAKAKK